MRLDDERESSNYEIQRGGGGGFGGGGGNLLGMLLPMIGSRFGCGGVVIALAVFAFISFSGGGLLTGGDTSQPATEQGAPAGQEGELTQMQSFSLKVLNTTERIWGDLFRQSGQTYKPAVLSFYAQNGKSGCGAAQSAMGPFYCPLDEKIYLDTDFFRELQQRFGAPGDFAQAYVIAHEVAHHVQHLEGRLDDVNKRQQQLGEAQANALQVRIELQADCYAGVWGRRTGLMETGDLEEGLRAAAAIGDDTLQKDAGRRPVPDSFTHGTSAQRVAWLRRGYDSGDPAQCDTFSGDI
ncbi:MULTISPECIES: neutral zinc metallopeptidase [unclassified Sphingobium]|uniref:KPN_02809 family neutral zinc metallopeptidase n=1 Tax=unclassified Sphingobium TaxID=2611147 RepID=UPI0022244557|nr:MULTISPECIES: neutral zinc metallopeptidase [unclassified Sphingobium]MCW2411273.1 putative metalloprotease [Sphingobium sp. B8D3D]MCW2416435.1 putative metalloprotease [Sphingobium sp. B8D3A]